MDSAERLSAGGEERGAEDVGARSSAAQSAAERELRGRQRKPLSRRYSTRRLPLFHHRQELQVLQVLHSLRKSQLRFRATVTLQHMCYSTVACWT